jgi:hypothetical protein
MSVLVACFVPHSLLSSHVRRKVSPMTITLVSPSPSINAYPDAARCPPPIGSCDPFLLPPPDYAIAILPHGLYAPLGVIHARSPDAPITTVYALHQHSELVPMAEPDWPRYHNTDESTLLAFATYDEALWWCRRREDTIAVLTAIEALTVQTEMYPDRNVWYRDEIEQLLHDAGYSWSASDPDAPFFLMACTDSIDAWMNAEMRTAGTSACHIHITASHVDELWEDLYAAVARWMRKESCP